MSMARGVWTTPARPMPRTQQVSGAAVELLDALAARVGRSVHDLLLSGPASAQVWGTVSLPATSWAAP
jgi:hypothetical protein